MKNRNSLRKLTLCALFAALTAVCAQITIPISVIPITLSLLAVYMSGAMLGPVYGGISMAVYLLLGFVGLPVFQSMTGGAQVLLGPTGGYAVGYIFASVISGAVVSFKKDKIYVYPIGMTAGCAVCYAFGTGWYVIMNHVPVVSALSTCVLPFIPGDIIKIALASALSFKLNKILKNRI